MNRCKKREIVLASVFLSLPTSFFIDEQGNIVEVIAGGIDEKVMTDIIEKM